MENNIIKNQILRILPTSIGSVIEKAIENMWNCVEEIRIYYPGSL